MPSPSDLVANLATSSPDRLGFRPVRPRLLGSPLLAVALVSLGCAGAESTNVAISVEGWSDGGLTGQRLTTDRFEIISSLGDTEFEAALPGFMEAAYERYQSTISPPGRNEDKLTMYVFGTRSEWKRFTRSRFPDRYGIYSRIRAGGYTENDISVSFYVNRAVTLATLAHEGWHQYTGLWFDTSLPPWLNEGLACYHEGFEFAGEVPRFTPRRNTFRINDLRRAIQRDTLLSLRELVDTDAGEVISRRPTGATQVYYAQAWALVTFLRHGVGGRYAKAFERLLLDITDRTFLIRVGATRLSVPNGADMSDGAAAFHAYFGASPDALQAEYYEHLVRVAGF